MKNLIKLQLRKSRLSFGVILAALLASVPLALGIKPGAMTPGEAVNVAMLYWALAGIPLTALILSGIAGSEAARPQAALTEQPLPVSQYRLLLSSLVAVLLQVAALALAAWAIMGFSLPLEKLAEAQRDISAVYLFTLAYLSLYGFTLSYAFRNGIAGAALAAAAAAVTVVPVVTMSVFQDFSFALIPLEPLKPLIAALALAGGAFALELLSGIADRKVKRTAGNMSAAALLLAAPALAALCALAVLNHKIREVTLPAAAGWHFGGLEAYQYSPGADGLMLSYKPFSGEIFLIGEDGRRAVIRPGREPREKGFDYLFPDISFTDASAARDRDGVIWVLYGKYSRSARLASGGPGGFTERASFADGRVPELAGGREPVLIDFRPDEVYYSPLPAGKKGLAWKKIGANNAQAHAYLMNKYLGEGTAAEFRSDGKTLAHGRDRWTIPGALGTNVPVPGLRLAEGTSFLVPAKTKDGYVTYLCRPGAKAEAVWPGYFPPRLNVSITPDGTAWAKTGKSNIAVTDWAKVASPDFKEEFLDPVFYIITRNGKALPPVKAVDISKKTGVTDGRLYLLRAAAGSLWFNAGDKYLVKADAGDTRSFRLWKLPPTAARNAWQAREGAVSATFNGILIAAADGVYFMDWDGAQKKIY
ncbi:MAG: hypothetical protein NTY45_16790 [Elusimicrobia bacterium]|nr:hypothetical protein [Elusimicrobiota bacterium]